MTVLYTKQRRGIIQRPQNFLLNPASPLSQGLVFAGLGNCPGGMQYRDSSVQGNHGTLTSMAVPATATSGWAWDNYLRRWANRFDETGYVLGKAPTIVGEFSISVWAKRNGENVSGAVEYMVGGPTTTCGMWYAAGGNTVRAGDTGIDYGTWTVPWLQTDTRWHHLLLMANTASPYTNALYFDGITYGAGAGGNVRFSGAFAAGLTIGSNRTPAAYWKNNLSDPLLWAGNKSSLANFLADPSNVMLSGLILPPRRRLFAAGVAATGNRRRRLLITGAYR